MSRLHNSLIQMFQARNYKQYDLSDMDLDDTSRVYYSILTDENSMPILFFSVNSDKLRKEEREAISEVLDDNENIKSVVILYAGQVGSDAKKKLRLPGYDIQLIHRDIVLMTSMDHMDKHVSLSVLSPKEEAALLSRIGITATDARERALPALRSDMPLAQYYWLHEGQIVEIRTRSTLATRVPITLVDGRTVFIPHHESEIKYYAVRVPSMEDIEKHKEMAKAAHSDRTPKGRRRSSDD